MRGAIAVIACALVACGGETGGSDAGTTDAGGDSGPPWMRPDAGPAGASIAPLDPCDDVAESLYGAAAMPAERGALIGCAHVETIDGPALRARLVDVEDAIVTGGVELYLVAFRTERDSGAAAVSTALVALPEVALSERVPMVLAMHGSVGLADACAPSRHVLGTGTDWLPHAYVDAVFLGWAARGLPVIAPDYAGLGTEGTHAYLSWIDGAISGIDAARALRDLIPSERTDGTTLVYGHSQGGGLALSVGALAPSAPDLDVGAIVAEAPAWRVISVLDALALRSVALDPVRRVAIAFGITSELEIVGADPGIGFSAAVRSATVGAAENECYEPALRALDTVGDVYVPPATIGELVDEAFGASITDCAGGGACNGPAAQIVARDAANEPHLTPASAPVLVVGSRADEAVRPGVIGCVLDRVRDDGASADLCMAEAPDHLGVVGHFSTYAVDWALAAARGEARPPCSGSSGPLRCQLF